MHRARRQASWWLTEEGRSFTLGVSAVGSLLVAGYKFLPNAMLKSYFIDRVHLYRSGEPVPVSEKLQELFVKSLDKIDFSDVNRRFTKPFMVFGFELFTLGSSKTKYGSNIGLPGNYDYETENDVDTENILVNNKPIDWTSEAGIALAKSLVLNDDEKIFGMCRELLSADNFTVHKECVLSGVAATTAYVVNHKANEHFKLFEGPRGVRVCMYVLVFAFTLGVYFLIKDSIQLDNERTVDKRMSEMDLDTVKSGITFYDKILQRNIALKKLTGHEDEFKFSNLGNENYLFRKKTIPILDRKTYFENKLKEFNRKTEDL